VGVFRGKSNWLERSKKCLEHFVCILTAWQLWLWFEIKHGLVASSCDALTPCQTSSTQTLSPQHCEDKEDDSDLNFITPMKKIPSVNTNTNITTLTGASSAVAGGKGMSINTTKGMRIFLSAVRMALSHTLVSILLKWKSPTNGCCFVVS
jgi:hypothetical protein